MVAPTNLILNGCLGMEALLGNPTFSWNNETFACIANTLNDQQKNVLAGLNENADFRMTVRLNQFSGVYPALNDYITYLGYQLLIKSIKKPAHGVYWVYVCELPSVNK
jgi:hypothetical protein